MDDKVLTALETAKKVLEDNRLCKGDLALDKDGNCVLPRDPNATQFCALGALDYAITYDPNTFNSCVNLMLHALEGMEDGIYKRVSTYNDRPETTKEDILALFDKAIGFAELH